MTPDIRRGSFHCRAVPGDKLSHMVLVVRRVKHVWSGLGAGPVFFYAVSGGEMKTGPEKSDPTQLSYHSPVRPSTAKWEEPPKICILHKSECAHLGNIPS